MDLNQEQLVHEVERKYMAAAETIRVTKARIEALEAELEAKRGEIATHKARVDALETAKQQGDADLAQVAREKAQIDVQLKSVSSLADQRLQEIHAERGRVADQAKQLVALQTSETKALQAHARLEAQLAPLQIEVSRLRKEVAAEKAHLEEAQSQLVEKSRAFTEYRLEAHKKISDVEHQCISAKDDAADLRLQVSRLQDEKQALRDELRVERESNLEIQTEHERVVGHLEKELAAQHRLTDLYKDASQTASSKVDQLQALCESLQTSLKEAEDALAEESSKVREESQQATMHLFKEQMQVSEAKIDELESAVAKANARVAELEAANAAAARRISTIAEFSTTAGELHLAENGLSASDMYERIVQLDATVEAERAAKEKLEVYLQRVLSEIQAKAPYLERLKKENARALASHDALSDRLESVTNELGKARDHLRAVQKDKEGVESERDALQQSVTDLSRQIQTLLYASVKGPSVPLSDETLVVYRNIEELQVRNQQLLKIVRDLSEKTTKPSSSVVVTVESDEDLVPWSQAQWETVHAELATLREERAREQEMVSAIVKQRDMYRVLLSQADARYQEQPAIEAVSSKDRPAMDLGSHDARLLRELRAEFEDYKKEKQALVTSLRAAIDTLRGDVSKAKVAAMEASVEAKANQEKFVHADARKAEAETDVARFRAKYEQCNSLLLEHQATIAELSADVDTKANALLQVERNFRDADAERTYLRRQEERLTLEVTQLRLDSTNQLKLMDAVRRIESFQTDRNAAELERVTSLVSSLETKVAERQKALDDANALSSAHIAELQLELKAARKGWEADKTQLGSVREVRVALDEQVRALQAQVASKNEEVLSLRATLAKGAGVAAAERVAGLETALEDAKRELHSALTAKQTAETHADQYKVIADAHEKSLAALSASSAKWKEEQSAALAAALAARDKAAEEMASLQKSMLANAAEENKLRREMDAWDAAKRLDMQKAEERALLAEKASEAVKKEVVALQERLSNTEEDLQRTRDDYTRELQKHLAAVVSCNDLRREVDDARRVAKEQQVATSSLQATLDTIEARHTSAIAQLQAAVDDAVSAKVALSEQNHLLHSQLEVLTQDIAREHNAAISSSASSEAADEKQLRDLRGVVTYLRREHSIAESKAEIAQQETLRFQSKVRALEKTVEKLKAEQEAALKLQATALTTTEDQGKRTAMLDQLSLLRESNATLRAEMQAALHKVKEKEAAIAGLEAKVGPLQKSENLLKGQIQNLNEDIESLNQANKRWKTRVDQLIEKYQQIDPEEHEKVCAERNSLKTQVEALEKSAADATAELAKVQPLTAELEARKNFVEERCQKLQSFVKNWKERAVKSEARTAELEAAVSTLEAKAVESDAAKGLEDKIKAAEGEAKKAQDAEVEAKKALDAEADKNDKLKLLNSKLMAKVKASAAEIAQLHEKLSASTPAVETAVEETPTPEVAVVVPPLPPQPETTPVQVVVKPVAPTLTAAAAPAPVVTKPFVAPMPFASVPAAQKPVATVTTTVPPVVVSPPLPVETKPALASPPLPSEPKPVVAPSPPLPNEPKPVEADASATEEADASSSLREMALKSLLKKSKIAAQQKTPASPAKPTVVIPAPAALNPAAPVFNLSSATTAAPFAAPFAAAPMTPLKLDAPTPAATSPPKGNPFLNLMPPTAFGSSGPTGLVFGGNSKITLPVPTLPADTAVEAPAETEEQRLQQRLMRFKRVATNAIENEPPAKKVATTDEVDDADEEETKAATSEP